MSNSPRQPDSSTSRPVDIEVVAGTWSWSHLHAPAIRADFEKSVARRISGRRWFGAKSHLIAGAKLLDTYELAREVCVALVEIHFADRAAEIYQLPLAIAPSEEFSKFGDERTRIEWARVSMAAPGGEHVIFDALARASCCQALHKFFNSSGTKSTRGAAIEIARGPDAELASVSVNDELEPRLSTAEQSNSSVRFGERLIAKVYRRIEPGINPDWEINACLAARGFRHIPSLVGAVEYRQPAAERWTLVLWQGFVPNACDGWSGMLEQLTALFDTSIQHEAPAVGDIDFIEASTSEIPLDAASRLGESLVLAGRLGERTAEMHCALAAAVDDPAFCPEPFAGQRREMELARTVAMTADTFERLHRYRLQFRPELVAAADVLLRSRSQLEYLQREAAQIPIRASAIRIHGDFHLGQVLLSDQGPIMIDFEGEPARPLAERREKQLALRDVAGMIRSFHYASCTAAEKVRQFHSSEAAGNVDAWARAWYHWASANFLRSYRAGARGSGFLPTDEHELRALLNGCILDKAIYELRYELNNRPDWIYLPLGALIDVVAGSGLS